MWFLKKLICKPVTYNEVWNCFTGAVILFRLSCLELEHPESAAGLLNIEHKKHLFLFTEEFRRKDRTSERLWIHTTNIKINQWQIQQNTNILRDPLNSFMYFNDV
jgi:hypothetical protein